MTDKNTPTRNIELFFLGKMFAYFSKHPAIGGSCIYIVFTVFGTIYSWNLYRQFQINIFDYAEANDFLLIAFKEPRTLILTLAFISGSAIIATVLSYFIVKLEIKYKDIKRLVETTRNGVLCAAIIISVLYVTYLPYDLARNETEQLVEYKKSIVNVLYEEGKQESTSVVRKLELSLIGSTEKFMFFYDHSDNSTMVIPITKIVNIKTQNKKTIKNEEKEAK